MHNNYGIPYLGSKNKLAQRIIDALPPAKHFYDVFAGGCAVTHAAMLSGKYEHIHINDIDGQITQLFIDAIHGKYAHEDRWIDRQTFFDNRETNIYIATIWSFGNNRQDYIYGKQIEQWKHAYWEAAVHGDFTLFCDMGIDIPNQCRTKQEIQTWINNNIDYCKHAYIRYLSDKRNNGTANSLSHLESLERLGRLQSLERLGRLQSLERLVSSYEHLQIEPDSVIYCDPPYKDCRGYQYLHTKFDSAAFYDWCIQQKEPIYISEYNMPSEHFCIVKEYDHVCNSTQTGAYRVKERLFTTKK